MFKELLPSCLFHEFSKQIGDILRTSDEIEIRYIEVGEFFTCRGHLQYLPFLGIFVALLKVCEHVQLDYLKIIWYSSSATIMITFDWI